MRKHGKDAAGKRIVFGLTTLIFALGFLAGGASGQGGDPFGGPSLGSGTGSFGSETPQPRSAMGGPAMSGRSGIDATSPSMARNNEYPPLHTASSATGLTNPTSSPSSMRASQTPSASTLSEKPELLRSVAPKDANVSSFAAFFVKPMSTNSGIKGKSYTVAELLEGVQNASARKQLLQSYWTLSGKLARYNFRLYTEQNLSKWNGGGMDEVLSTALNLAGQQRRAAELDVIKGQWQLAEQIKRFKSSDFNEETLPIPCDYPVFKDYTTHADSIARSQRSRHLGRMIPLQEQLVASQVSSGALSINLLTRMQSRGADGNSLVSAAQHQSRQFDDMVAAVVTLNSMIGEYAAETVGSSVSHYQFVGTLVELPKADALLPGNPDRSRPQYASPAGGTNLGYRQPDPGAAPPSTFAAQPSPPERTMSPPQPSFSAETGGVAGNPLRQPASSEPFPPPAGFGAGPETAAMQPPYAAEASVDLDAPPPPLTRPRNAASALPRSSTEGPAPVRTVSHVEETEQGAGE